MKHTIVLLSLVALTACGGGGGSEPETPKTTSIEVEPTVNTPAEFSIGIGLDSGEIDAESTALLIGSLTVTDPDPGENAVEEQLVTQGDFGQFSITTSGDWSYTMTNFASDFVAPEDIFTVTSIDGTEHQVTIFVKGLYQRLTSQNTVEEFLIADDMSTETTSSFAIENLFKDDYIESAQAEATDISLYKYNEQGNPETLIAYQNIDTEDYSLTYEYEYLSEQLAVISTEKKTYYYDGNSYIYGNSEPISYRINEYIYNVKDSLIPNYTSQAFYYNESDEIITDSLTLYDINYNNIGKRSDKFSNYPLEGEEQILRYEYFYHENGNLDYQLYYRATLTEESDYTLRESALNYQDEFYYHEDSRVSYTFRYYYDEDGNVTNPSDPRLVIYLYNDELDVVIIFYGYTEGLLTDGMISSAVIYQYEDIDQCGDSHILLNKTTFIAIPGCRIKVKAATTSELPQI
ncbi:MAG: VCBS domain-containing protein [Colwellia sp.]